MTLRTAPAQAARAGEMTSPASPRFMPSRRQRRAMARQAPARSCHWCGADVSKLFNPDLHVAKHLEAEFGIPRGTGRRQSRENDAGRR